ncbi:TIGR00725 family protein [Dactylosporangium roseum]|uniref:TIGR00725 family protein n=1 Tax=Dactylosporangium roseum TaxID=47989 RepID=A0ABY5YYF6_9ACTN|nr:TIGR00725 family protein [Dactylosporangium roseum]UWZ34562.1 TIGR00725 family protein [Dactylosporangium roseum]
MLKIGVIGNAQRAGESLPPEQLQAAEAVGRAIAGAGAALIAGGTSGVMEASARGAKEAGGLTVGFLPQADTSHAHAYSDLLFPTGMGTMRNVLTARCSDAIIAVGGGVGTLNEITLAYDYAIPIVLLAGSGGWSDRLPPVLVDAKFLDERRVVAITVATSPEEAVKQAVTRGLEPRSGQTSLVGWAGQ